LVQQLRVALVDLRLALPQLAVEVANRFLQLPQDRLRLPCLLLVRGPAGPELMLQRRVRLDVIPRRGAGSAQEAGAESDGLDDVGNAEGGRVQMQMVAVAALRGGSNPPRRHRGQVLEARLIEPGEQVRLAGQGAANGLQLAGARVAIRRMQAARAGGDEVAAIAVDWPVGEEEAPRQQRSVHGADRM